MKGKLPFGQHRLAGETGCGWNRVHLAPSARGVQACGPPDGQEAGEPEREHGVGQGLQICGQEYKQNLGHGRWVQAERAWLRGCWSRRGQGLGAVGVLVTRGTVYKGVAGTGLLWGRWGERKPSPPSSLGAKSRSQNPKGQVLIPSPHGCGVGAGVSSSRPISRQQHKPL